MRVLVLTQYFHPEVTAVTFRLHPLASGLAQRGHEVELICEIPSYPGGRVHRGYGGKALIRRNVDGVHVHHVWNRATPIETLPARLSTYAIYASAATAVGATRARPDVILASSPPLPVAAAAALLARRFRAPWILDVRDLWPAVAGALGEMPSTRALQLAAALERWLYRDAAAVTTVTEPFVDHVARQADREKVHLLPNGTTEMWLGVGADEVGKDEVALPPDRFVWTYAGNVGLSQDLGTAVEAARMLGDGYQLLILGEGTTRRRLIEQAGELAGSEVAFRDVVPTDEAARIMRASDALLVPLAANPELGKTIPVKLYDCCALGRPVVVAAPGESSRLAREQGIGVEVAPGDPGALAAAVRRLSSDRTLAERVSARAREFAGGHLREQQVSPLEAVLEGVIERRGTRPPAATPLR